ncbi:MAG: hypothetical protein M1825_001825 [Sarcosagium campestre]|nr:MAG: hypothetical protein M1825_001825 [Sarcosagium campestre]
MEVMDYEMETQVEHPQEPSTGQATPQCPYVRDALYGPEASIRPSAWPPAAVFSNPSMPTQPFYGPHPHTSWASPPPNPAFYASQQGPGSYGAQRASFTRQRAQHMNSASQDVPQAHASATSSSSANGPVHFQGYQQHHSTSSGSGAQQPRHPHHPFFVTPTQQQYDNSNFPHRMQGHPGQMGPAQVLQNFISPAQLQQYDHHAHIPYQGQYPANLGVHGPGRLNFPGHPGVADAAGHALPEAPTAPMTASQASAGPNAAAHGIHPETYRRQASHARSRSIPTTQQISETRTSHSEDIMQIDSDEADATGNQTIAAANQQASDLRLAAAARGYVQSGYFEHNVIVTQNNETLNDPGRPMRDFDAYLSRDTPSDRLNQAVDNGTDRRAAVARRRRNASAATPPSQLAPNLAEMAAEIGLDPDEYEEQIQHSLRAMQDQRARELLRRARRASASQQELLAQRDTGARRATSRFMESLVKLDMNDLDKDDRTCPICMERFCEPEPTEGKIENPVRLPCGHVFGDICIKTWLREHCTCPSCRQKVESELISSASAAATAAATRLSMRRYIARHQSRMGALADDYVSPAMWGDINHPEGMGAGTENAHRGYLSMYLRQQAQVQAQAQAQVHAQMHVQAQAQASRINPARGPAQRHNRTASNGQGRTVHPNANAGGTQGRIEGPFTPPLGTFPELGPDPRRTGRIPSGSVQRVYGAYDPRSVAANRDALLAATQANSNVRSITPAVSPRRIPTRQEVPRRGIAGLTTQMPSPLWPLGSDASDSDDP